MGYITIHSRATELDDALEIPTEEEIVCLWRSLKAGGLPEDEAWNAIATGIALDLAFARHRAIKRIDH